MLRPQHVGDPGAQAREGLQGTPVLPSLLGKWLRREGLRRAACGRACLQPCQSPCRAAASMASPQWPGGQSAHCLLHSPVHLPLGITAPRDPFTVRSKLLTNGSKTVAGCTDSALTSVSHDSWTGR